MNEINGVNSNSVRQVIPFTAKAPGSREEPRQAIGTERESDRVELSDTGTALAELNENGGIRIERVARIRSEIQNGLYDVNGKLESVIDVILDDVLNG
jgi:anti-sigma28 factor (negative regulator of flagellin synthesis)